MRYLLCFRGIDILYSPTRIPLSAFIVEDMQEYVHAHATYRFVLYDEDEELPRILVSNTFFSSNQL